jgi:DNA polymerase-3 subunit gamma/tau
VVTRPGVEPDPDPVPEPEPAPPASTAARSAAREAIQDTRPAGTEVAKSDGLAGADADADRDDLVVDEAELGSEDLLARELGAQMIEEIPHQ